MNEDPIERLTRIVVEALRTRAAIAGLLVLMTALLLFGITNYGLVNSTPGDAPVDRHRENKVVIFEDKDGCQDSRSMGKSNGVYLAVKKCDPGIMKEPPPKDYK
jgi:hypothetical protein